MTRSAQTAFYLVMAYGLVGMITDGVACAAILLKSFLPIPIWISFLPAALSWIAAGMRGIKPEGLLGVGAISLIGGPIIAAKAVAIPMPATHSMATSFSSIRQALALSLAVMLPLCFMSTLAGVIIKGIMTNTKIKTPKQQS